MKAFIETQFEYCPLVWIFHGNRSQNNPMNGIQERALRLVCTDYNSSYELLEKDGSLESISEIYNGLATEIY